MNKDKAFHRALVGFDAVYFLAVVALAIFGKLPPLPTGGFALAGLLGLAAFRLARALSFNLVAAPIREAFGVFPEPDSSGAGDNNHASGTGLRRAIGEAITCPICSGQWAALAMVASMIFPAFGQVLIYSFAAAGFSEVVHWFAQWAEWQGRFAREQAGVLNRQSRQDPQGAIMAAEEWEENFKKYIERDGSGVSNGRG